MTANYNGSYHKWYVNCRCTVCGSSGKGYASGVDPEEDAWQNDACHSAADLWNRRPYLNEDIRMLAEEIVAETLRKTNTDDVLLPEKGRKDGDDDG